MQRKSIAALCIAALAILPACSRSHNSFFDKPGYYVRGDKVYYLDAFPGSAAEIAGADAATFQPLAGPYAKDRLRAYFHGGPIPRADTSTFQALDNTYARDRRQVYAGAEVIAGPTPRASRCSNAASSAKTVVTSTYSADRSATIPPTSY
jgi:hypothetical protein